MQKVKHLIIPFIAISALLLSAGCESVEDFPDEPQITFKSLDIEGPNSATLKINFTDGDGDIGLSEADTLPPFCPEEWAKPNSRRRNSHRSQRLLHYRHWIRHL